ncbi:MAG: cysteine hydrolase [Muribaculaceae bacterium]|nr:cysteine hydrolase [Muribaculaceae bacterium]
MKKALLVIDMQNVCVGENHAQYFKYNNTDLIKAVNGVIEANKNNMVIYIKNIMKKNFLNKFAPFHAYEGTEDAALVNNLQIVSENVYTKYEGNAFSNPALNEFLKKNDIACVEVVGVDGGGCVALTALGAMKEGYQVIVNENAIGTMFIEKRDKYFKQLKDAGAEFI